jgi:two-component sensor histidine kinase
MGLRSKTLLILVATLVIAVLGMAIMSRIFFFGSIEEIERREAAEGARRIALLVDDDLEQLDVTVKDWAFWDDTYVYAQDRNEAYEESNLSGDDSMVALGLSSMVILDPDGKVVFTSATDPLWLAEIVDVFKRATRGDVGFRGIVRTGETLHLAAARPILRSDNTGPPTGLFAMTRQIDGTRIERYSRLSGLQVAMFPPRDRPGQDPGGESRTDARTGASVTISSSLAAASLPLTGISGEIVAYVRISAPRASTRYGTSSFSLFISAMILVMLGIGVVSILVLQGTVLGRIKRLGSELERIASRRESGARVAELGDDELGALGRIMNRTLDSLGQMIAERETMLREIHHGVKNNLQVIASLLNLQADDSGDEKTARALLSSRRRVLTMAFVHEELYAEPEFERVDAGVLLDRVSRAMADLLDPDRVVDCSVESEGLQLDMDKAIPFGLVACEVLENVYRHAFELRVPGKVRILARAGEGGGFALEIADDGKGIPEKWRQGLGLRLVGVLATQLKGKYRLERPPDGGTRFVLEVEEAKKGPPEATA